MTRFKIIIQESSYGLKTALIPEDEWNDGNGDISVFFNRMDGEVGVWTREEIELTRQWFGSVQDINPQFLEQKDYNLAVKIYKATNIRVPNSILQRKDGELWERSKKLKNASSKM